MRYLCIHGHFYQPPRENAWLEAIELQDGAAPFHDWNEKINFECYAPNAAARILDEKNFILKIVNNYEKISFNFGPTLLSWMQQADPDTYQKLREADQNSAKQNGEHGNALAQVYGHLIMPLANERDRETQIIWGIRDFEHRFGRKPEGMWLAETAVDSATLDLLAKNDIKFTVLAPGQAQAVRKAGEKNWQFVHADSLNTRRPYRCHLPSGKFIDLFFYDGAVSRDIAFNGLLNSGKNLAARFIAAFEPGASEPQLVNVATDGETYGHHHRHGEMALADAIHHIEKNGLAKIINYAGFLEKHPPGWEVMIHENSSWSCAHGIERWRSNCGCHTGGEIGWTQTWRQPLREALDWLRDQLIPIFEKEGGKYLADPWAARNDYIEVLLDRREKTIEAFLKKHCLKNPGEDERIAVLRLMEMQRQSLQMFTSCGWFFNEISGIETIQILQYANRALHYTRQLTGQDLQKVFLEKLALAPSNVYKNGAEIYTRFVEPARVNLDRVAMHYAASSLFEEYPEKIELFNYATESLHFERVEAGTLRLAVGRMIVRSKITFSKKEFSFVVLYLGQQHIIGNISLDMKSETYLAMATELADVFRKGHLGEVIGIMQDYFPNEKFTIRQLFRDEQRKILNLILEKSFQQSASDLRALYNDNYQLMSDFLQNEAPVPEVYRSAASFVVNQDLQAFFKKSDLNPKSLLHLAKEIKKWNLNITELPKLELAAGERLFSELKILDRSDLSLEKLTTLVSIFQTLQDMGIRFEVWKSQNVFYKMVQELEAGHWVFTSDVWELAFRQLGKLLKVNT